MSNLMRCSLSMLVAVWCMSVFPGQDSLRAQERTPVDDEGHIVDFERDIVPIFRARCLECHNGSDAKADFRIDDPDTVFSYVEPEDVESSTMFYDYMLSEDPDMLMPPPSKGGPMPPQELALVRVWIEEGANWPEGVTIAEEGAESEAVAEEPAPEAPVTLTERVWAFQGFLHPATVHFPIALLLFGAAFVVLGWKWPAVGTQIPMACLLVGALMAIASTAMGWSFAVEKGYGSWTKVDMDSEVFWHRWSGVIVSVTSTVLAIIAIRGWKSQSAKAERTWKIGLLVVAAMVGAVGHQGGEMTYGEDFYPKAFRILLGSDGEVAEAATEATESDDSGDASDEASEEGEAGDAAPVAETESAEASQPDPDQRVVAASP